MNFFAIVAVIAIGVFVIAEVLVSYQKYQLKKIFLEQMDKKDAESN